MDLLVYFLWVLLGTGMVVTRNVHAVPVMSKRIINGFLMPDVMAPYVVSLNKRQGGMLYVCGGSIISPNHILTAGHCVVDTTNTPVPPANITIGYGNKDNTKQLKVTGASITVHPQYINGKMRMSQYDMAIVKIPTIQFDSSTDKISIYDGPVAPGQNLMAMGWGSTEPNALMLSMLRGVLVITGNTTSCQQFDRTYTTYDGPQICTLGSLTPDHSTCGGDSGNSVVINSNNKVVLAGINSVAVYGTAGSCGSSNSAHFFVRPAYDMEFMTSATGLTQEYLTGNNGTTSTSANGAKANHNVVTVTQTILVTPTP
ncbi:Transmembrane protease serine 2 [Coemansia sp. RSA 2611]|nr:Transmembrane protease serine 2 [Coemansia sp. RSA 2611]